MRTELPPRRPGFTAAVPHTWTNGKENKLLVTFGFDGQGHVREVFCADFKAGSDLHALIIDACVSVSLLLQHGETISSLVSKFNDPPSLIGTLIRAAENVEKAIGPNMVAYYNDLQDHRTPQVNHD